MSPSILKGSPKNLRRQNRQIVLRYILNNSCPLSRTQIVKGTKLTGAAISRIIRELIEAGILIEGATFGRKNNPGRRFIGLEFTSDGAYVIGIGIAAHEQLVSISNIRGETLIHRQLKLLSFDDPKSSLESMAIQANKLIQTQGIDRDKLIGGGAFPSLV